MSKNCFDNPAELLSNIAKGDYWEKKVMPKIGEFTINDKKPLKHKGGKLISILVEEVMLFRLFLVQYIDLEWVSIRVPSISKF